MSRKIEKGSELNIRRNVQLLLALGVFLVGRAALAGEFQQSITLPMTLEYDSNPAMSVTDKKGVTRAILTPDYNLTTNYGIDEYKLGLGLRVERSSDQEISVNRDDPSLSLGWQRQTEAGGFGLVAKYAEASTRFTELQESGLVQVDGTRTTYTVGGNWSKALSERSTLAADAEYKDVAYDGGGGTLIDFTNTSAGLTYSRVLNEHIEPFMRTTVSHYEPSSSALLSSSFNFVSVMGGVNWKLSENLDWTGQAGPTRISGQTTDSGWQGSVILHYLGRHHDALLDVGRYVSASGEGGFVEVDQVKGTWGYAIDELTRAGLEASRRRNRSIIPNTVQMYGVWASRELSPFWHARLSYQYKQRKQDGLDDATANVLGVTLVYSLPNF
ncbi:MAG: hypothetical protein WAO76_10755 [Georgfuchsia sp.]